MARLSVRQKKNINRSFSLTRSDRELIKENNNDWNSRELKPLKDRIREFYKIEQNRLCAFCKLPFRDDIHIEHVVPKAGNCGRPEFTFYPKNLVAACKHCNTQKSTVSDLVPWTIKPYPPSGHNFRIIHPHFDKYFDHIEIVDKSRYVYKTTKGPHTIERCGLHHPSILEVLAESMKYQDDPVANAVFRFRELEGDFKTTIDRFFQKYFN